MIQNQIADKYVGIPYKHHGRTLDALDCWGLMLMIYKDLGYKLLDINDIGETEYEEKWAKAGKSYLIENYYKEWERIEKPIPLCGVAFKNDECQMVHVGVMLDHDRFIHCRIKHGVIISKLSEKIWKDKFVGFYKLKAFPNDND